MTVVVQLSTLPLVHTLGWTLLNFCWQGALVALLLACALGSLPSRDSRRRYSIACAAMVLMVVLPALTFVMLQWGMHPNVQQSVISVAVAHSDRALNNSLNASAEPWSAKFESIIDQSLPEVIGFWLAGVLFLLCRLNVGLIAASRLKFFAVEPAAAEIQNIVHTLRLRLGVERVVKVLNSVRVEAPIVIGWLRPVILLPLGWATGMSTLQIEAILAHELAHIRRQDYLISLFQSVMETVLFYHPAVRWVSNQIRREREHCCDDIAVTACGDRLAYAKALSLLEERRSSMPAGVFGATGGVLKIRIARLLGSHPSPVFPRTATIGLLMLSCATGGLSVWRSARAQSTAQLPVLTATAGLSNQAQSARLVAAGGTNRGAGNIPGQSAVTPSDALVHVRSLKIDSADLPDPDRLSIIKAYQGSTYPLEELSKRIRQNLRDTGYIKAVVEILVPSSAPSEPAQPMDVSVRVSAGTRYKLSGFSVEGEKVFSQDEIIQQFSLHPGDLFNATAIGKGLESLRTLYKSKGYDNFIAVPKLKMDEVHHTVILILDVQEGKSKAA